jgi:ribosomal protein S18 acetylase RimI-like enzyme
VSSGGPDAARGAPFEIRKAAPREPDRVAALWTLLLAHHATAPGLASARAPEDALRAHLAEIAASRDALLVVADRAGALEGFAVARVVRRPALFAETRRGEIEALFVRADVRRGGVGRALAEETLRWLAERRLGRAALTVAAANTEGQRFWRALGFRDAMDVLERPL